MYSKGIATESIQQLLGIQKRVPLTFDEMRKSLRLCFFPHTSSNVRLEAFQQRLHEVLTRTGSEFVNYEEALAGGESERVPKGIVLVASGEAQPGNLPIDHISSLSENVVVNILDSACPAHSHFGLQAKLNAMMSDMAWHFAHVIIYLEPSGSVTVCNWNGAMIECFDDSQLLNAMVPKLAAPVVPPRASDYETHKQAFNTGHESYASSIADMVLSGSLWAETGLMISQTPVSSLTFRNKYYRRLGTMHLDHRTGMSYGFLARQLPLPSIEVAMTYEEARTNFGFDRDPDRNGELIMIGKKQYLSLMAGCEVYLVPIPDVSVLSTRSGCEKTRINPHQDIVRYRLSSGQIIFETPHEMNGDSDCKPSYDTPVIMAHALANAIIASVLARRNPKAPFYHTLKTKGLALAHWHGFLDASQVAENYPLHGESNPGVSCSTPQSAIYAMQGKLSLLENLSLNTLKGDVHTEPHHGTNFTCASLRTLARWLQKIL